MLTLGPTPNFLTKDSNLWLRAFELLLLDTIENLGIVGDVVKVKPGYARNYLLPHGLAQPPTEEKIARAFRPSRGGRGRAQEALRG